jgi:hypothetical protein
MQVTVNVNPKTAQGLGMDWDMTQDHSVHHMVCSQLTEVFTILNIWKDVVVATDQHLVPVQAMQRFQSLAVDNNVTQVVHLVSGTHTVVPTADHFLVHLVRISPWTQFHLRIIWVCEATDPSVSEVCVADQKYCWHLVLLSLIKYYSTDAF